ncbi:neural cell adhesion molecule L1-like protein isoform X1 [Epinephelus fuscoguttatus]|uniref:neural cell adhesion molecule L1-like protein isoform X1 n=1 Tax=Epinephelus fuscoguttatus TaxID=293821 RepID=UPI0020D01551|nr:neural cell adhesion molecule L1-like protein isoform X1 [Epinephelus fuscoguttatus]XP_049437095.1 neural cell adhesion molecule L1-like protein isoform X1 [Epinephelus fuscoguttatus]XP_049437096.1 neural cell adhesion molecule L1-like protein isoform X1 [Epinephelus fuscoguttatus]XP_049437097.1 neural cell adhesion molecule L1-like protein isoform X1 [Epinephelus fuscoguttatus]
MRLVGSLQFVLLLALTSTATGLNIPLEVEQPPTIINHTSGPIIALPFDNTVAIRCEARGNPPPKYRWSKDGKDFVPPYVMIDRTDGTFVLHKKHLDQFQGKFRCYASNKLGTAMTEEIELRVPSIPKFPKENNSPLVVKEGDPIILECNPPEGVAPRQIYWMSLGLQHIEQDERVSMGIDGNLYFSNALQKDSRPDYCCFAAFSKIRTIVQKTAMAVVVKSLKAGNDSSNATVAPPARLPDLLLPSGVQTVKVLLKGENLHLECLPQGYPTPTVTWMKMGDNLPPRTKYANFGKLLTISAVDGRDQGRYMCTAQNYAGKAVHYFDVIVEEPPKWLTEPPQSQLTVIGSDVHIKCSVSGKPPPDITWRRNGEIFRDDPNSNRRVFDDTVVLHNAVAEDSAVYQCEASNSHGSVLANINILVMNMAPRILTGDYEEYAVVLGGNITMNCSVFGSPPPTIFWARDESPETIEGERFFALGGSLRIISAEKNDSGKYVCVASNAEGKSAVTAVLDVKDPTKIVFPPQDMQIVSGTTAQLMCQAEYDKSLRGSFEVVWRKDGEEIPLSFEGNSRYAVDDDMLQIMNVNLSDQGVYTCIARTSLDEDSATALFTVLDVPDAPQKVKISDLESPRNISLTWVPGSDHNSSVTEFIVEFEESQWEPGRWKELQKVPGNQATAELALHGHLNYQFRVYAVNAVGPGPPSEPTERYKTPPAAPERNPENIRIQGHLPHQMDISWEPLLPIEQNGPGLEYKVSYRKLGVEDVWREHLVKRHSFVVRNTSTFVPYEIKIQSKNSYGWGPDPKVVTGYSGEDVPTAAPRDIAVEVINTTVLRVSWTLAPPATVRGHLGGYDVQWLRKRSLLNPNKILDERHSLSFPGKRTHAIVPGLEPFSEYRLTVNVFNKKGNGPNSDPVTFNTSEGVPEQVPILTASNAQTDSILLVWGPPLQTNGILTGYVLQHHLINETTLEVVDSQEMNITGADTTQWQLQGLEEDSLYRFHLSACTRAGCGPPMAQESHTVRQERAVGQRSDFSTQGWFIGTMCAVALLTLVVLMACFVRRNKGGKYAGTPPPTQRRDMFSMEKVKEKEDLHPDLESQGMNDDTFCEYSDSEEKPLKGSSLCSLTGDGTLGDSVSRDSLVDYADGGGEFNEDGSFIGEYSGRKREGSVSEPSGPRPVTA